MDTSRGLAFPGTLLLGAATIAFGFWGYLEGVPEFGITDALYGAIQLLGLEYNGPAEPPWQLDAGRYLGALTLALAVVAILAAFARDRADRVRVRLLARHHHIVVGLGTRGRTVASTLHAGGVRTVAVSGDDAHGAATVRAQGVPVITGGATLARTYLVAATRRAEHVFISLGDDSVNLQALDACLAAVPDRGPTLHVAIDGYLLWRELHRSALSWSGSGGAIEFVSVPDRVATRLVDEAGAELATGRIIVWGVGPTAARTAVQAVRWVLLDGGEPRLTLAGPHAEALEAELARTEPWIATSASMRVVAQPAGADPGAAFVAGLPHADVLAGAGILANSMERVAIVAEVPTTEGAGALCRSGFPTDRVRLVDAEPQALGAGLFEGSARELIARARHAYYVQQDLERGVSREENPSLVPWEQLPDSLRKSNRDFAASVGKRLADLGAELEPLTGPVQPPALSETLVETLAEIEHDRWMHDLLADGWRYHDGPKDPERKLHPLLIAWDDLPEAERDKDRDGIRSLPLLLARLGYELRIVSRN